MTWREFRDYVDAHVDHEAEIWWIDVSYPNSVDELNVSDEEDTPGPPCLKITGGL